MKKPMKKMAALTMTVLMGGVTAFASFAMPSDVGGTQNGQLVYAATPENLYWNGSTAHWDTVHQAAHYEIQLYRGGTPCSTDTTSSTHISYKTLMQQSGEYTFRVRSISSDGTSSSWSGTSENHHVSGYSPEKHASGTYNPSDGPGASPYSPGSVNYGWTSSKDGFWMWKDSSGNYAKSEFRTIDGHIYYFDQEGSMFTGWLALEEQVYYFHNNGIMQVGGAEIDGRDYYFNDRPGPGYGAQIG